MRLTHRTIDALRHKPGRTLSLVVTDRCLASCTCSQAAADAPSIRDFKLFERLLDGLAGQPSLELVTLTGGEPFVERRGLGLATRRLHAAGKLVAVITSGAWAANQRIPDWVHDVLTRCDCVTLRTDGPHVAAIDDACLVHAAREITAAEAWLVVQVSDDAGSRDRAAAVLNQAFGGRWDQHAEIQLTDARPGPGELVRVRRPSEFGPCALLRSPTLRYDGVLGACGNEQVSRGLGPARLRRRAETGDAVRGALAAARVDPLLRIIGEAGLRTLIRHPDLRELGGQAFADPCELCWAALARLPQPNDLAIAALANDLGEPEP